MSFLTRTAPLLRTAAIARPAPRLFSTAVVYKNNPVKDAAKTVDRTVSDQLVKGIDKGVELKDKAAEAAGIDAGKAKGKAQELAGEAKGKAAELKGEAKGKAEEVKAKM